MKPAKNLPKFHLAPSSLIQNSAGQKLFSSSPTILAQEKFSGKFHNVMFRFKRKAFISVMKMMKLRVTLIMKLQNIKFGT